MYFKHGMTGSKIYNIYRGILERCYNRNHHAYERYGGRGIRVCGRWRRSFVNFYNDIGRLRPGPEFSLDRFPDKDGGYEPGNVRWATREEQANNTSANVMVCLPDGRRETASRAARILGLNVNTVLGRLGKGRPHNIALSPTSLLGKTENLQSHMVVIGGERISVAECARRHGKDPNAIYRRLRLGWEIERAVSKDDWRFGNQRRSPGGRDDRKGD